MPHSKRLTLRFNSEYQTRRYPSTYVGSCYHSQAEGEGRNDAPRVQGEVKPGEGPLHSMRCIPPAPPIIQEAEAREKRCPSDTIHSSQAFRAKSREGNRQDLGKRAGSLGVGWGVGDEYRMPTYPVMCSGEGGPYFIIYDKRYFHRIIKFQTIFTRWDS